MNDPSVVTRRYGEHPSQFVDTWEPISGDATGDAATLHGGWWRDLHDLHLMDPICRHLAAAGWRVHNIEYRRTGRDGGGWPQSLDDTVDALRLLARLGSTPDVLIGHSAGGHLALMASAQVGSVPVVGLAPVTDLVASNRQALGEDATAAFVRPATAAALRAASPVARIPPARQLIVHGAGDQRVPVEQSRGYVARAVEHGGAVEILEVPGGDHFCVIDPGQPVWRTIDAWLADVGRGG